jgi:sulfoquinovose isomerase
MSDAGRLMNIADDLQHQAWLADECERLLKFAEAARHPQGGFAWLQNDGRPDLERPVELWITARMTHVFSLAHMLGRPLAAELAEHGVDALTGRFSDSRNGGWWASVDSNGPTGTGKLAYEHAFVLLAAASAATAGVPGGKELLDAALDIHDSHFWDEQQGAVVEQWDSAFVTLDPYLGANANMHTVEALLAAAELTRSQELRSRALRILTRLTHTVAAAHDWRLPEHYTAEWMPLLDYNRDRPSDAFRPYGATVGHAFEWARLSVHLAAALGDDAPAWIVDDAQRMFAAAVSDGWAVDGAPGFVYTTDWEGTPVVRARMHWVATEAIGAATVLHRVTGDETYAELYSTWWEYAQTYLIDPAGSWHHELSPDNHPASGTWSGKPDVYHAVQATLLPRLPLTPSFASAVAAGQERDPALRNLQRTI